MSLPITVTLQLNCSFSQLWDVISDQQSVELIREIQDAQEASTKLLKHALSHHTTDNVTIIVIRFKQSSRNS